MAAKLHERIGELKCVVFDLGHKTFNCTVLHIGDGVINVVGEVSDVTLGGENVDIKLAEYCLEEFNNNNSTELDEETPKFTEL